MAASELQFRDTCCCVAFSPFSGNSDGQQSVVLAVGLINGTNGTVALCDVVSGSVIHTLQGETKCLRCVDFSPCVSENGGRLLVEASTLFGAVRLWDMQTKQCVAVLEGHTGSVYSVAFSPDGSLLASASSDSTVRLWDVATRSLKKVLQGHTTSVYSVAFSSCGRLLASASYDCAVRLWNMPEGTSGPVIRHNGWFSCVAFSRIVSSNLLASCSADTTVRLWDVSGALNGGEAKLVRELKGHTEYVLCVAFSPDGSTLASSSSDSTVKLWSVASGTLLKTLEGHTNSFGSVSFHPSGHQLAAASFGQTVRIWTICEWSDRRHDLFGPELKRIVFVLMCVKQRQEINNNNLQLSMELWLDIFSQLSHLVIHQ